MKGKLTREVEGEDPRYPPSPTDLPMDVRYMEVYVVISKENNDKKVETSLVELRDAVLETDSDKLVTFL